MRKKSKPMMHSPEDLIYLRNKNDKLVKELVEYKSLRKQLQEDMDYVVREKFITDQKLHRLESICLDLNKKTKSCLDKIVLCSTDLADMIGLLSKFNKIKQSLQMVDQGSVNVSVVELIRKLSRHEVPNRQDQNASKKAQEDVISQDSSFTTRVLSTSDRSYPTSTTNADISNNATPTREKKNTSKKALEEDQSLQDSSFVSRGGNTVLQDSNAEIDSDIDLEVEQADDTELQNDQTPAGKALSVIYEDGEKSGISDKSQRRDGLSLPNINSVMSLPDPNCLNYSDDTRPEIVSSRKKQSCSDNEDVSTNVEPSSILDNSLSTYPQTSTFTPNRSTNNDSTMKPQGKRLSFVDNESTVKTQAKRLSFIARKSIGSPLPSLKGTTTPRRLIMRKSLDMSVNMDDMAFQRPLIRKTNSPLSSTTISKDRVTVPSFLDKSLKIANDLSYLNEFIKNTSTPIQGSFMAGSKKKSGRTGCDGELKATNLELNSNVEVNISSDQEHADISSLQLKCPDVDDATLRNSKRRRCPTINPLQKYLQCLQSERFSRAAAKSSRTDDYVEDDSLVDQSSTKYSDLNNQSTKQNSRMNSRRKESSSSSQKRGVKSEQKSRAAARSTKFDSYSEEEASVDNQSATATYDLSMNKNSSIISKINKSPNRSITKKISKRVKASEPDSRGNHSTIDETVQNMTPSVVHIAEKDGNVTRTTKRKKSLNGTPERQHSYCSQSDKSSSSAKRAKLDTHNEDESLAYKTSSPKSPKDINRPRSKKPLISPKKESPRGSKNQKTTKRVETSKGESDENEKNVQNNSNRAEENSEENISQSRHSRRKKNPAVNLLQHYVECSQRSTGTRSKRAVKKVEYKEPPMNKKMRRS